MPHSMTGFARHLQRADWGEITCEIRSVNHRYLEPSIRLPELLRPLEPTIREQLRERLQRGKVEVSFYLSINFAGQESLSLNQTLLNNMIEAVESIQSKISTATLDPVRLLQWPGIIEETNPDEDVIQAAANDLLDQALSTLITHRLREGEKLKAHIEERLDNIAEQVALVRGAMPEILKLQKEKIQQRLEECQDTLDEGRLEQEMVLIANKADVAEELDRLESHLSEVRQNLKAKGAVGRRLDFMMQELNREANTLSSKSLSTVTTQAAVTVKVLIEQMREQIQNIE